MIYIAKPKRVYREAVFFDGSDESLREILVWGSDKIIGMPNQKKLLIGEKVVEADNWIIREDGGYEVLNKEEFNNIFELEYE